MHDDGVVKYNLSFNEEAFESELPFAIEEVRERLYSMGLIGAYEDGIGYGNISHKVANSDAFVITGTQTGHLSSLQLEDYSWVEFIDFKTFTTTAKGLSKPSSEAITHGAIYALDDKIEAVIHIHNEKLWRFMLDNNFLSTNDTPYGTPEMVKDVQEIYNNLEPLRHNAFVMKGHFEGVVTFGSNLKEAEKSLYQILFKFLMIKE